MSRSGGFNSDTERPSGRHKRLPSHSALFTSYEDLDSGPLIHHFPLVRSSQFMMPALNRLGCSAGK